ncbi:MAG: hypothetical protein PHO14_10320 [Kiritimatiellae bacterium]|jgi:hypothetical protein|nr:hypothetical protein [Kiritimatiellia bacterium]MDD4342607.1 hypothetical protein [Kiritimatiellia bacterium]MDY0149988.1 hypothetical protein [Kiritimatiellia bacterium]
MQKIIPLTIMAALLLAVSSTPGQEVSVFDSKHNAVLSRLQSMGHGYYSQQEWAEVEQAVNELMTDAVQRQDGDAIIRATVIQAMVLSDMRHQHEAAIKALQRAREIVRKLDGVDASRLFVKEAEVQAAAGNADAIQTLIADYKASADYDPQPYAWSGGTGPGDPLVLTRPSAAGQDSLPLSIMESALARASAASGETFPDTVMTDVQGHSFTMSGLRGNVVLVDFFARGWKNWEDDRALLRDLWGRYNVHGFEIVNICLERNPVGLELAGLPGRVVPGAPALARSLGVFGDRTTFLLDSNGQVIARNLRGQDLAFAVRHALGR